MKWMMIKAYQNDVRAAEMRWDGDSKGHSDSWSVADGNGDIDTDIDSDDEIKGGSVVMDNGNGASWWCNE